MQVTLQSTTLDDIYVNEMSDGDIGIITEWHGPSEYVGRIVQRYGNNLIAIGMPIGQSWPGIFDHNPTFGMVRLLKSGEKIVIV